MVFKNFITVLVAIVVSTTAFAQTDLAQCDFVFVPTTPVDPTVTNVVADFNFIPGFALIDASGGTGFTQGATFTEDPDDVFNVHNAFSEDAWTCLQTADFAEGLPAQNPFEGPSGVTWNIQSAECSCDN